MLLQCSGCSGDISILCTEYVVAAVPALFVAEATRHLTQGAIYCTDAAAMTTPAFCCPSREPLAFAAAYPVVIRGLCTVPAAAAVVVVSAAAATTGAKT